MNFYIHRTSLKVVIAILTPDGGHPNSGENLYVYGGRNPAIFFMSDATELKICSAINGNTNRCFVSESMPLDQWTTVIIEQAKERFLLSAGV